MRKKYVFIVVIMAFIVTGCKDKSNITGEIEASEREEYVISAEFIKAKVDGIHDGDSIFISYEFNGEPYSGELYLAGIDAPELIHPIYKEMPFGKKSKLNLEKIIQEGSEIYIETNEEGRNNPGGRTIGYAYTTVDGKVIQLNEMQVKDGLARVTDSLANEVDTIIVKENYKKLVELEEKAKSSSLNIWSIENFITENGYNEKYKK